MTTRQIRSLLKLIGETDFIEVEIETGNLRIRTSRISNAPSCPPLTQPQANQNATPAEKPNIDNCIAVKPPLPGTFYLAQKPDAPPFVKLGDIVKKGQVLCIIEAMKMMNIIESEVGGKIIAINTEDGAVVDCADVLFLIEPTPANAKNNNNGRKVSAGKN